MLTQVLAQFPVERVILVADRGLLSVDNIAELTESADVKARQLQFILAVPARRYSELCDTVEALTRTDGLAESTFAGHRLVVAHDPVRPPSKRRVDVNAFRSKSILRKPWSTSSMRRMRGHPSQDAGRPIGAPILDS